MSRDCHDILMDQLLRELLGGDRPRDLTERVLARARVYDQVRRTWRFGIASAVAACLALGITLWTLWPRDYPAPAVIDGPVEISNNASVQRGSRLVTRDENAAVALGGYVNIDMSPHTIMTIGGGRFEEKVMLEQGDLDVKVAKNRGQFDVVVGPALVHVTGTKFQVGVSEEESDDRHVRKLRVAVKEGSVQVETTHGEQVTLAANSALSEKVFDLSAEPTQLKVASSAPEQIRPGARLGALRGAAYGSGENARPGLIGPNYVTSSIPRSQAIPGGPFTPGPNRGGAPGRGNLGNAPARPPIALAPARNMQIVTAPGEIELSGTLRREGDRGVLYLETDNGPVLLFAQQALPVAGRGPFSNFLNKRVKVKWENGEYRGLTPTDPVPQSGTF